MKISMIFCVIHKNHKGDYKNLELYSTEVIVNIKVLLLVQVMILLLIGLALQVWKDPKD